MNRKWPFQATAMRISPENIPSVLEKSVAGFYFCSSDDTFLVNELVEKITDSAKKHGFKEITRCYIESASSWDHVYTAMHSPSLFSPNITLVIQLNQWKLDDATKTLLTTASQQHLDDLLVIVKGPKIERAMTNTQWFQAMTKDAYWIDLPTIYASQMPTWLQHRAASYGMKLSHQQAQHITERTENNLPAAAQAIEKLSLLNRPMTHDLIEEVIEMSAEFDVFKLIDACLSQNSVRAHTIFCHLKNGHAEPLMMIGAFARELRLLRELYHAQNASLKSAAQRLGIWESRLAIMQKFMRAHSAKECQDLLAKLAHLDAVAKGVSVGDIWNELLLLCMDIAGSTFPQFAP